MLEETEKEIGIYIHIPFCKSKCYYCDFFSCPEKLDLEDEYIDSLVKEIKKTSKENRIMYSHEYDKKHLIKTIYIGGGTPSVIKQENIKKVLDTIKENYEVEPNAEITIEVNPGTVTIEKLQTYKDAGINRLSIGLQSTSDKILKQIGRIHNLKQFIETYNLARQVGFLNINVDLMIGLPNQELDDVKNSIKELLKLDPEHISVYSLILEEGTKLDEKVKKKELELIDDDKERQMYWYVKKTLEKHKYIHYEISNFAKCGFESRHNMDCWEQKEYLGFGAGASSFIDNKRFSNISNIEEYIENIKNDKYNKNLIFDEKIFGENEMKEYMMLGLRKIEGINITDFVQKFHRNPIIAFCNELNKLTGEGLIVVIDNNIKLTNKGIDFANLVWEEFV